MDGATVDYAPHGAAKVLFFFIKLVVASVVRLPDTAGMAVDQKYHGITI